MISVILKDFITICWCLAIDSIFRATRDAYTFHLNKYHTMNYNALTRGEQYRIQNLTRIGTRVCHHYSLPHVHIYILLHDGGCFSHYHTIHLFHINYFHYNIEIGRDELDFMSFNALVDGMIHEIGHNFTRQIIIKHHLCKYFWALSYDDYISLWIYIIGLFMTWIPYGWILDIVLFLYLMIGKYKMDNDKNYRDTYNRWKEIVADEFALSWTHNLHDSAEDFRQENSVMIDESNPRQTVPLVDQLTFQSPYAQYLIAQKKYYFLKAYSEDWYHQRYDSSDDHPSDVDRMKHLEKFAKNGYKW